ncbi:hypothetical protein AMTR_s00074p00063180 [Amborella trichopoda]|uniref:Uncharacterized protein n=1 Tax=Amborella trichopoda TaxID=13333 RepID=W1NPJ2_AMBTC|nr:hypothetical protein AMTR_s00074p00063180 [Amborella trichopoda]
MLILEVNGGLVEPKIAVEDADAGMVEPGNAVVVADTIAPLNVIPFNERPLLHYLLAVPAEISDLVLAVSVSPSTDQGHPSRVKVAAIVHDNGMDFNFPIGVVFKDIMDKLRAEYAESNASGAGQGSVDKAGKNVALGG